MLRKKLFLSWGLLAFVVIPARFLQAQSEQNKLSETYQQLNLFNQVFDMIRMGYPEPVDDKELIEGALKEMASSLDPHSQYLSSKDISAEEEPETGYGGIGVIVEMADGAIKVTEPVEGSPADQAAIQADDLIVKIDGQELSNIPFDQAIIKLRGPIDSKVIVSIKRGQQPIFDVELTRALIQSKIVRSRIERNHIAYIQITTFEGDPYKEFVEQLNKLKAQTGKHLIGMVLDLRGNLGGWVKQAVLVADAFLDRGEIGSTVSEYQQRTDRYQATPGDMIDGLPLIILVNEQSASASEILAAALQDQGRAIILGVRTYGKATAWNRFEMEGGGVLQLTTSFAYGPSGKSWQIRGIQPDIVVEQGIFTPDIVSREYTEEKYPNALKNPLAETAPNPSTAVVSSKRLKDNQLQQALNMLEAIHILGPSH